MKRMKQMKQAYCIRSLSHIDAEVKLLWAILFKHNLQHRRLRHWVLLRRSLSLLCCMKNDFKKRGKLNDNYLYECHNVIHECGALLSALVHLGHFLPLTLCVIACLARIDAILEVILASIADEPKKNVSETPQIESYRTPVASAKPRQREFALRNSSFRRLLLLRR